ncbi:MAG: hypothetical protein D6741_01060 [Planctomycetota bacterium]|nr:MAG: hypothetical protein D6741_01060 [Planctomycetota bacterium]
MRRPGYTIIEALAAGTVASIVAAASATLLFYAIRRQADFTEASFALHQIDRLVESIRKDAALADRWGLPDESAANATKADIATTLVVFDSAEKTIRYESTGVVIRRIESTGDDQRRYEVFDVKGRWECRVSRSPFGDASILRVELTPQDGRPGSHVPRGKIVVEAVCGSHIVGRSDGEVAP